MMVGEFFMFYGIWGMIDGIKYVIKGNFGYYDVFFKYSVYNWKVCFYFIRVF